MNRVETLKLKLNSNEGVEQKMLSEEERKILSNGLINCISKSKVVAQNKMDMLDCVEEIVQDCAGYITLYKSNNLPLRGNVSLVPITFNIIRGGEEYGLEGHQWSIVNSNELNFEISEDDPLKSTFFRIFNTNLTKSCLFPMLPRPIFKDSLIVFKVGELKILI